MKFLIIIDYLIMMNWCFIHTCAPTNATTTAIIPFQCIFPPTFKTLMKHSSTKLHMNCKRVFIMQKLI